MNFQNISIRFFYNIYKYAASCNLIFYTKLSIAWKEDHVIFNLSIKFFIDISVNIAPMIF